MNTSAQSVGRASQGALSGRIQDLRVARGWGIDALARRASLSRTTVHNLERGHTPNPRAATLKKLAEAFGISVSALLGEPSSAVAADSDPQTHISVRGDESGQRQFDRHTNPVVDEARAERPRLFMGWSNDNWDELYSEFGVGGPLTFEGVVQAAEAINRKRETLRQLSVVLDTDLGEVAARLIATLHAMVQASERLGPVSRSVSR